MVSRLGNENSRVSYYLDWIRNVLEKDEEELPCNV